jgi:hypothetical protein
VSREFPSLPVVGEVVSFNAGDVEGVLFHWAENATVTLVGAPFGIRHSYRGREQIHGWFRCLIAKHTQVHVKVVKVAGHIVTTRTETRSDWIREFGMTSLVTTETYVVHEGKITCLTVSISSRSRISLQSALQAQHEGGDASIQEQ